MNIRILLASFALVFLAELGDKTQLAALTFTTSTKSPWTVFIGTSLALITATALAVMCGAFLSKILPEKVLHIASGVMFVLMGLILLVNVARKAPSPTRQDLEETTPAAMHQPRGAIVDLVTRQAVAFEEDIVTFLEQLIDRIPDGHQQDVVRRIVAEDRHHLNALNDLHGQHRDAAEEAPEIGAEAAVLLEEKSPAQTRLADRRCTDPGADALRDDIQAAIDKEEAAADFYLALARIAKIHELRDAFRWLAMEDIRHAQALCSLINPENDQQTG